MEMGTSAKHQHANHTKIQAKEMKINSPDKI
jgi:hypothetical protein